MLGIRRRPLVVDAVLAMALFGVLGRVTMSLGDMPGWAWVWLAALHLPLVVRRRRPVAVFWTVTAMAFVAVEVGATGPALVVVPAVAGYTLARHRARRALWPVTAPAAVFVVGWWWHGGPLWDALTVVAGFAACVLLGAYLGERDERAQRLALEREQRDRLAVAEERARIAREMHDIVAHNLAVMVALADGAAAVTPTEPARGADMMRKTAMTGRQALTEVRKLVDLLRESKKGARESKEDVRFSPPPGLADLDELVGQVRAAGLAVTLTRSGPCGGLGPGPALAIYRIVQEALTNTIKHAGPHATVSVELRCDESEADVVVTDDGGDRAVPAPARSGHGLTGMTERAAPYGGHVEAGPGEDRGWRVHAHLALDGPR
jgi:signal transduction histidine kinase